MCPTDPAAAPDPLPTSIAHDELNRLPIRRYEGPIHVVVGADVERAREDLLAEPIVGFDTETRPAFRPGESYLPSLVQFATANAVYLLQIQQHDLSALVRDVLSTATTMKVGVSVAHDVRELKKQVAVDEQAVVDLGKIAARHGIRQTGVRNLAAMFLGVRVPKGAKTTNWAATRLTAQQVAYAATDAWICRELYLRFRALRMVD